MPSEYCLIGPLAKRRIPSTSKNSSISAGDKNDVRTKRLPESIFSSSCLRQLLSPLHRRQRLGLPNVIDYAQLMGTRISHHTTMNKLGKLTFPIYFFSCSPFPFLSLHFFSFLSHIIAVCSCCSAFVPFAFTTTVSFQEKTPPPHPFTGPQMDDQIRSESSFFWKLSIQPTVFTAPFCESVKRSFHFEPKSGKAPYLWQCDVIEDMINGVVTMTIDIHRSSFETSTSRPPSGSAAVMDLLQRNRFEVPEQLRLHSLKQEAQEYSPGTSRDVEYRAISIHTPKYLRPLMSAFLYRTTDSIRGIFILFYFLLNSVLAYDMGWLHPSLILNPPTKTQWKWMPVRSCMKGST